MILNRLQHRQRGAPGAILPQRSGYRLKRIPCSGSDLDLKPLIEIRVCRRLNDQRDRRCIIRKLVQPAIEPKYEPRRSCRVLRIGWERPEVLRIAFQIARRGEDVGRTGINWSLVLSDCKDIASGERNRCGRDPLREVLDWVFYRQPGSRTCRDRYSMSTGNCLSVSACLRTLTCPLLTQISGPSHGRQNRLAACGSQFDEGPTKTK